MGISPDIYKLRFVGERPRGVAGGPHVVVGPAEEVVVVLLDLGDLDDVARWFGPLVVRPGERTLYVGEVVAGPT